MFVKPGLGLTIRDPRTRQMLPEAGAEVVADAYWRRRLRDGDVVLATSSAVAAQAARLAPPSRPAAEAAAETEAAAEAGPPASADAATPQHTV